MLSTLLFGLATITPITRVISLVLRLVADWMQVQSLHAVDSLNVNVAAAIVLERIFSLNRLAA